MIQCGYDIYKMKNRSPFVIMAAMGIKY